MQAECAEGEGRDTHRRPERKGSQNRERPASVGSQDEGG
jgi:hypothetical protein